jgi:hypothetical protein
VLSRFAEPQVAALGNELDVNRKAVTGPATSAKQRHGSQSMAGNSTGLQVRGFAKEF